MSHALINVGNIFGTQIVMDGPGTGNEKQIKGSTNRNDEI
jgi:hypothetical protein